MLAQKEMSFGSVEITSLKSEENVGYMREDL
jgi:hypothetical protein